jgi:hypothetical protein
MEVSMRKVLTAALAAITFGAAVASAAAPAQAEPHRYYGGGYERHHDNDAGVAVAAGVVGLALGAALAGSGRDRGDYDRGYYNRGYDNRGYYNRGYAPGYAYGYGYAQPYGYYAPRYRTCESRRWVYDPYVGGRVMVRERYAC